MDQNLVIAPIDVPIVVETAGLGLIKVFLLFNKHVHNVLVVVKKLQIHAMNVMVKEIDKHQKKYQ